MTKIKRMKVKELVDFIKVCNLWKCNSCGGGPCYFTGEFPDFCPCDGKEFIEGCKLKGDKVVPDNKKIKWVKIKLVS